MITSPLRIRAYVSGVLAVMCMWRAWESFMLMTDPDNRFPPSALKMSLWIVALLAIAGMLLWLSFRCVRTANEREEP